MKKIAFIGNNEPPAKLLDIFRKQTPGRLGVWKNLKGVDNYKDADYFGVIDYLPSDVRGQVDESKCVFLGAHPETLRAYRDMSNYKGLKMFDCKHAFGFGEWWLAYDYDYLKALGQIAKTRPLGCIMSNAETDKSHLLRKDWLRRFTARIYNESLKADFDLYGRIVPDTDQMKSFYREVCGSWDPRGAAASGGNDHMSGKERVLEQHKYMLEFDNIGTHYFSERVFDTILMWGMPIYFGGTKLHEYLGDNAFRYLDITGNGLDVQNIVYSRFYEDHIEDLAKARTLLLDKYQLWPRIHEAIFGEP